MEEKKYIQIENLNVSSGSIAKAILEKVDISKILISMIKLGKIDVYTEGGSITIESGSIQLSLDVNVKLKHPGGTWKREVTVPFPEVPILPIHIPVPQTTIDIPSTETEDVNVEVSELPPLDLGSADINGLSTTGITIPSEGYTLSGLGIDSFDLNEIVVPQTTINNVSINELKSSQEFVIPEASLGPLPIPETSIPKIEGSAPTTEYKSKAPPLVFPKVMGFQLTLDLDATISIKNLKVSIQDLNIHGQAETVTVENVKIPIDIKNASLETLILNNLTVPKVSGK